MFEIEDIAISKRIAPKLSYYQRNRATRLIYNREYQRRHKAWRAANPDKVKAGKERSRYGCTSAELLVKQDNRCAICNDKLDLGKNTHMDHKGKVVRGVLCRGCNLGIGFFKDRPDALRNAALYLEKYQEKVN